ncbi:MAG: iron transporter, partial [Propionibacteriaceae bacterium]|nr:iron transporter [Propionibacteriaceae bacterium]
MKMKKLLAGASVLALLWGFSACSGDAADPQTTGAAQAPAPGDDGAAGFEEFPIGDPQTSGPLDIAAVYFQPVDMAPAGMGLSAAES